MTRPSRSWGRRPRGERPRSGETDANAPQTEQQETIGNEERTERTERTRSARAGRPPRAPREAVEPRDPDDFRAREVPPAARELREPRGVREPHTGREPRAEREPRSARTRAPRDAPSTRSGRGPRAPRVNDEGRAPRAPREASGRTARGPRHARPLAGDRPTRPRATSPLRAEDRARDGRRSRPASDDRYRREYRPPDDRFRDSSRERGHRDWVRTENERVPNSRRGQPRRESHLGGPTRRAGRDHRPVGGETARPGAPGYSDRGRRSAARDTAWPGAAPRPRMGGGSPGNTLEPWEQNRTPAGRRPSRPGTEPRRARDRRAPGMAGEHRAPAITREVVGDAEGVLELSDRGFGFLRQSKRMYHPTEDDVFVPPALVKQLGLREGLKLSGPVGRARNGGLELLELIAINDQPIEAYERLVTMEELTPTDPDERLRFATGPEPATTRVVDLLTPVGKGQRALIVAPPRSGKTVLLQHMAHGISENHPEVKLKVLLVDERPEEVTDMKRTVRGEVVASSSDMNSDAHVRVAELVLEQSRREVEFGHDVVIFLDSLTRLGRAYNRETGSSGRTLTGGIDARALERPKRIFGAARNIEHGGSLTIIATALIETGSRMDEVIFQEFKGTGNMEMVLDRSISDMRIWPAVDVRLSGTRKEEKLYTPEELPRVRELRRQIAAQDPLSAIQEVLQNLDYWEGKDSKPVRRAPSTTR